MTQPKQKPGRSKQSYGTPREFLDAVERRFGVIVHDLAASAENAVCSAYFDEERNGLIAEWPHDGTLWLNPPFGRPTAWLERCDPSRRGWTLVLLPASVSTNWFRDHVHGRAFVMPISPRLTFAGESDPFPKDLMLLAFGFGVKGFEPWQWMR